MPKANEYRCSVGGEWKGLDAFSKNQQKRGKLGDRKNSGMICMEHSQPVRSEITCTVCVRVRPIENYSITERKSDNPRCEQCVAWDVYQEHGVVPIQLATGHVSIEEPALRDYSAPTDTADFFEPEALPGAPISGPESLGLPPGETTNRAFLHVVGNNSPGIGNSETSAQVTTASYSETASVVNETKSTTSSRLPPHLRGRVADTSSVTSNKNADPLPELHTLLNKSLTMGNGSVAKSTTSTTTVGMTLPPHLQGKKKRAECSEVGGSTTGSISTATTLRKDQEEIIASRKINYNAWDSQGAHHRASKNPTEASSTASVTSSSSKTDQDPNLIGDWDNVPDLPVAQMPQTRGNSKWPKASELRFSQAELRLQERTLVRPN
ncbi:hypothetical protein FPOAC2_07021 [Fusarium poae]|uniref:Stc1 domain-containing protein n=1 Tax=Fusarium poae TaxID=36050 RepID=A0A1B8AZ66_FUSPO|nr:hypothetical protein FPOAC1_006888 [Fusarium poae]KAG8673574.1 hypothetical protein FPOAC1_006888 [Fusarium poae]OBS25762.1 hypothetical protein FPOA_06297 [Fusarium poae]